MSSNGNEILIPNEVEETKPPAVEHVNESDDSCIEEADHAGETSNNYGQNRREKRLHMNRESARARRKRKKFLLEALERQVAELSKQNQMYRLVNETLSGQVQQLESDLAVANATIVMMRSGNGGGAGSDTGSHIMSNAGQMINASNGGPMINSNENIHRLLASQSRGLFQGQLLAASPELSLLGHGQDMLHQRQQLQSQLSQVNVDNVLANLLHQQQRHQQEQQPTLVLSPRRNEHIGLNELPHPHQDTLASAVELGRLREIRRLGLVGGDALDSSNLQLDDPRKKAFEAIFKYQQQQNQSK